MNIGEVQKAGKVINATKPNIIQKKEWELSNIQKRKGMWMKQYALVQTCIDICTDYYYILLHCCSCAWLS